MKTTHADHVRKAVVLAAGLSTRFLPLSKVVPKELWPLVDRPVIQYLLEEMKDSGIEEVTFVLNNRKKKIFTDYFKPDPLISKTLKAHKKEKLLEEVKKVEKLSEGLKMSFVTQKTQLGDAHALLQAESKVKKDPFVLFFCDDLVDASVPCTRQLLKVFHTYRRPLLALSRVAKDRIPSYGICEPEKIANRMYRVKGAVEKPGAEEAPSDLAIVGRYVLTPDVFEAIKAERTSPRKELRLSSALNRMAREGNPVYGYEFEGTWLECGTKERWLESNFFLAAKDKERRERFKEMLS